jgi:hypothetical protein
LKRFFLQYPKLHLWFAADVGLIAAFFLLRGQRWLMTALADTMAALRRGLAEATYRTDISVAEVLCVLLVAFAVVYLAWSVIAVIRSRERLHRLYSALLGGVCVGVTIYTAFCWLWGFTFYIDGFQEKSGIYAEAVALEDLQKVTAHFAQKVTETADSVARDENGLFAVSRDEILEKSVRAYDWVDAEFPFLAVEDQPPKAVYFSRILSRLDFSGIFCPYTGEANVNVDCPAVFLPTTAAHELAHLRGFSSEQECNFLGILAAVTTEDAVYNYSGWLMGYVYLGNALYSADREAWQAVYSSLPETARADLINNNRYWEQFEDTTVRKVSNTMYDGLLKGYGEEMGIRSYGTVVDMLVAYYKSVV